MGKFETGTKRSDAMRGHDAEPALEDMLNDPMTLALMASDGVAVDEVKDLLVDARRRYGATASRP